MSDTDKDFVGSIPEIYETYLVPLIFESYASDLSGRVAARSPRRVLELAAGTGVVTRALAKQLPADAHLVATDLNQDMLDHAMRKGVARDVEWRRADAMALPFEDGSFDVVVCQFGVMFFPDKPKAFAEARRVLRPGGAFVFTVWDRLGDNEFADVVTTSLESVFPEAPPRFLARTPYAYYEQASIGGDLTAAGFTQPARFDTATERSRASSPHFAAIAFCQGTPLRSEIEALGATRLEEATDAAAQGIAQRFGSGPVDAKIQAVVVTVESS